MKKNYSTAIADYWKNYLTLHRRDYNFDEETGTITCKLFCKELNENTDFLINIDEKNFRICAKLPVSLDEEDLSAVSDFISGSSNYILFSRLILDYDTKTIFCASGVFCGGKAPSDDAIALALHQIDLFIDCSFEELKCSIFKNRIARTKK